jgi:phosphoglycerate kinase
VAKKTVRDVEVAGKKVLVRVDFNVPLSDGQIADDTRIRAALPTIRYLLEAGAAVILMSHLGRPKGVDERLRLRPVAERLSQLLGMPVQYVTDCVGPEVKEAVAALSPRQVLLLENLRFHPEEEANDPQFSRELASLADLYVNDAFGSAHRAHASTVGVAQFLPAVAGFLMERELQYLSGVLARPERPFYLLVGGAKISDKIGVLQHLAGKVDGMLVGGGMANTFLLARGYKVGASLVEPDKVDVARDVMAKMEQVGKYVTLPVDVVIADEVKAGARTQICPADGVPDGWKIVDIGPRTVETFRAILSGARTVVWNGPMGVFEIPEFSTGTRAVAQLLAELTNAVTIVCGGESVAAVEQLGLAERMTHVSTGGGAALELLEGKELPGVAVLQGKGDI